MDDRDAQLRRSFEAILPRGTPFWRDASFRAAAAGCPVFAGLSAYLPDELSTRLYPQQDAIEELWSSYRDHGYGFLFYGLIRLLRPRRCIEIGVLHGFSLLTAAAALRDNGEGRIDGFDLFERYAFRHGAEVAVRGRIENLGLGEWADVRGVDAADVVPPTELDYLHVDISNDGDIFRWVFDRWAPHVRQAIVLEGGAPERDEVDWMVRYRKPSIVAAIEEIRQRHLSWDLMVLSPYPSVTVAFRKSPA